MLRWSLLLLGALPLLAGTTFEVPPIQFEATHNLTLDAPMEVAVVTLSTFGLSTKDVTSLKLDASGKGRLDARKLESFAWLGFRFTWKPKGLPPRSMIYEIRANKGAKQNGAHAIKWSKDRSGYLIDGKSHGDCDNLFAFTMKDNVLWVSFTVPATYLECQNAGGEVNRVDLVGKRDINKGLNYYRFDDDLRMGQQFAQELGGTPENTPLQDPLVNAYIRDMVQKIGKASDMPDLEIKPQVIDADVLNAFAVPGGYIWVYRGLIENTETEAELAGVIAHEIAHVTSRHGTEGMTAAVNKVALGSLAGKAVSESTDKKWLKEVIQVGALAGTNFWVVGGTRKREAEADKLGVQYAYRAGYDPMGIANLFARWSKAKAPASRMEAYFSDHPTDDARVKAVTADVSYFLPPKSGLTVSSDAYLKVKARLKQLPRPKQPGAVTAQKLFSSFSAINQKMITTEVEAFLYSGQQPKSESP